MRANSLLAASVLILLASAVRADDGVVAGEGFQSWKAGSWEFGIDLGYSIPAQKGTTFGHSIDNARAYDLLAAESVGDEVAEGFVAPPLPGYSTVVATMRPTADVGLHVYRAMNEWLDLGIEGGYSMKRSSRIDDPGIYRVSNFLTLEHNTAIIHVEAPVKVGPRFGGFRPYVIAGPGFYDVIERARISFNDADDPQLKPLEIIHRDGLHFGAVAGAGVEERIGERGLLGLELDYHKVFASRDRVDFLTPRVRFAVAF